MKKLSAVLALILCVTLFGCDSVSLEDTGGIADPKAVEPTNLVDPSQQSDNSFLYDTSIGDLTSTTAEVNDGQTVKIEGEVVGDIRKSDADDNHYWITLQSNEDGIASTISVYCTQATTSLVDTLGAYGRRGTTLAITGTFNISCSKHDGLLDVHAESVSVTAEGNNAVGEFDPKTLAPAILSIVTGVLLLVLYNYLSYRKKLQNEREEEYEDEDIEDEA